MKVAIVAGARPNFIKISPILKAIQNAQQVTGIDIQYRLVHTGQHYNDALSGSFFRDLNIPQPDVNLNSGSGSQAEQTAAIMVAFEKDLLQNPCDLVLVVGDVNSTMACSIVAKKLCIDVAHVEAGIRSFDLTMPEEINRMVTDALADLFFTTTEDAGQNLVRTGARPEQIHFVGNTMIDTLKANLHRLEKPEVFDARQLEAGKYLVVTLHRPSNVDDPATLYQILEIIREGSGGLSVIFPVHPRTQKVLNGISLPDNFILLDPLRYLEFMYLIKNCKGVVTDSGGIQEETTWLKIPCITLRENTERPETHKLGTNELTGLNKQSVLTAFEKLMNGTWKKGEIPPLWDGETASRIVKVLEDVYCKGK